MSTITNYERMHAAVEFKKLDRVPVSPLLHYASARYCGKKVSEYATDIKTMVDCSLYAYHRFGYDSVILGTDVALEGEAIGCKVEQPEDAPMYMKQPVIQSSSDLDRLEVPDPRKVGRMPLLLEAAKMCRKELGKEGYLIACANGPINNAGQFRGIMNLMMDSIDDPKFFERILDYSLAVSVAFSRKLIEAGADMILSGEALASPNFINPEIYRKYILPRQMMWANEAKKAGAVSLMHICGDIHPILGDLKNANFDCLDIDYKVDMSVARNATGIAVRGNIDPASVLMLGTPADIDSAVKAIMEDAKEGGGLILGTGCDVSTETPEENIAAMVKAAHEYGQY